MGKERNMQKLWGMTLRDLAEHTKACTEHLSVSFWNTVGNLWRS